METYTREEGKTEIADDSRARELLRRAFEKTSRWPRKLRRIRSRSAHQREWRGKPPGKSR